MQCSHCGSTIPFDGQICPVCKVDKLKDKQSYVITTATTLGLVAALIAGFYIAYNYYPSRELRFSVVFAVAMTSVAGGWIGNRIGAWIAKQL